MNLPQTKSPHGTQQALTLIELLIVLCVLFALAGLFALYVTDEGNHQRPRRQRISCVNNLKQVGLAFRMYALDNDGNFSTHFSRTNGQTVEILETPYLGVISPYLTAMSNELSVPRILYCPADMERTFATNFAQLTDTNISYFLGLDATEIQPRSFLCGDRNLTNQPPTGSRLVALSRKDETPGWTKMMHSENGTLAFADGSVDYFANRSVPRIPEGTTNRLALPQ
jgi:hypothetical protein